MLASCYDHKEIERVLRYGPWESWAAAIQWLEDKGCEDSELAPSAVRAMAADFRLLDSAGEFFTDDAKHVANLVRWLRRVTH